MKTIICHSFPAWDTPYVKSTLELITRSAPTHRVIFLDYAYTWKDFFTHPHMPKSQVFQKGPRIMNVEGGSVEVYYAFPVIPCNWAKSSWLFSFLMTLNAWIMGFTISKILRTVDLSQTVLINAFNPVYGVFTHKYWRNLKSTYYCYDEIAGTQWAGKWGKRYEKVFAQMADQIITTSKPLAQKFLGKNPQIVQNGVNLDIFTGGLLEKVRSNKIGYIGAIDERIDQNLLIQLALQVPEMTIEMIGPIKVPFPAQCPENIRFIGPVSQAELPDWIRSWEVCLIPFVKTPLTNAIYPLKINEYLMAGKPVVTTSFTDLDDFGSMVSEANSPEEFLDRIRKEARYNNRLKIQKRMDFARNNSWENRTELFLKTLAS
ncbi:glycosyltransferase involved in cell wall biosynthesis [Algoriphagus boseongensis]|uniref:Glycosyltransferase involved in cell wall biosynthesis n=1 Tax=Algoriphagus boseongensis TaxID=1442587 RepID=A0A4R6T4Z9_9BACT|nr:glycosyltransferase [Algoriphagus boseongensis]TDQ17059.1 glycosyltransferase involved in cell wall biosynthesis [Algoriphagus boseongensis]